MAVHSFKKSVEIFGLENSLGIAEKIWRQALEKTLPDEVANIRHAELGGNIDWRLHVAKIPDKVTCHVHFKGQEIYEVVEGQGILNYGPVIKDKTTCTVAWENPIAVKAGDTFTIPEGYAHQLVRTGASPLTILFACPDSHLSNDRLPLVDAPLAQQNGNKRPGKLTTPFKLALAFLVLAILLGGIKIFSTPVLNDYEGFIRLEPESTRSKPYLSFHLTDEKLARGYMILVKNLDFHTQIESMLNKQVQIKGHFFHNEPADFDKVEILAIELIKQPGPSQK